MCEHGARCDPVTGACLCLPGFVGSRCQDGEWLTPDLSLGRWPGGCAGHRPDPPSLPTACPAGWFGPGCQTRCSCGNDGHCHPATGHCSCAPGWTGLNCQRGTETMPVLPVVPPLPAPGSPPGCRACGLHRACAGQSWALLQPVTVDTGGPTAATPATAPQATGAVMPSVACACVRLATWAHSASSVSPGGPGPAPGCARVCGARARCGGAHICMCTQCLPACPHRACPAPPAQVRQKTQAGLIPPAQDTWHLGGGAWCYVCVSQVGRPRELGGLS